MSDDAIKVLSDQYFEAEARGDAQGMKAANDAANAIRAGLGQDPQSASGRIGEVEAIGSGGPGGDMASKMGFDVPGSSRPEIAPRPELGPRPTQDRGPAYDAQAGRDEFYRMVEDSTQGFLQSQLAQIESMAMSQVAELEMAYSNAIEEGKISVRDAERQYEKQKQQIEKQAYIDKESIRANAQHRGIQNSQQMMGMQMGADARTQSVMQESMSDRDQRVNDIRDRLARISEQKDLDIARTHKERDYNILGAEGQAQQMKSEQLAQFASQDHFAQQGYEHDFQMQDSRLEHDWFMKEADLSQDAWKHETSLEQDWFKFEKGMEHDKDMEDKRHSNTLSQMAVNYGYDISKMDKTQRQKIELVEIEHNNFLEGLDIKFGHDTRLTAQKIAGDLSAIGYKHNLATQRDDTLRTQKKEDMAWQFDQMFEQEEAEYQRELERDTRGITPGTKEYDIAEAAAKKRSEERINGKVEELSFSLMADELYGPAAQDAISYEDEYLKDEKGNYLEEPKDWRFGDDTVPNWLRSLDPVGTFVNMTSNRKANLEAWENASKKDKDAINRKIKILSEREKFMENPYNYIFNNAPSLDSKSKSGYLQN